MSLTKYQVHDETSQVSYTTSLNYGVGFASNQMVGFIFCVFRFDSKISCLERYLLHEIQFFPLKK